MAEKLAPSDLTFKSASFTFSSKCTAVFLRLSPPLPDAASSFSFMVVKSVLDSISFQLILVFICMDC